MTKLTAEIASGHKHVTDDGAEGKVERGVFKAGVKSEDEEVVREEASTGWP